MPGINSFAPVENPSATMLILGSMPGRVSLESGEYYAHPRNAFWTIMGELVGAHPGLPYNVRLDILRSSGIAVWDVLESCIRKTSLDSCIETSSEIPNDFKSFFLTHRHITRVFFNGTKAEQCFLKYAHSMLEPSKLEYRLLPSTSPANAGLSYQQKLLAWQIIMKGQPAENPGAKDVKWLAP
jgi:TDG/mug DNA glycosylase family protein